MSISDPVPRPEWRIGDVDRERAVGDLGEHYVAGRLTREEHDERVGVAWTARTANDLRPLFADLPLPNGGAEPAPVTRSPFRLPPVPVLLLLLGLALLVEAPLLLLAGLGVLWFTRSTRSCARRGRRVG